MQGSERITPFEGCFHPFDAAADRCLLLRDAGREIVPTLTGSEGHPALELKLDHQCERITHQPETADCALSQHGLRAVMGINLVQEPGCRNDKHHCHGRELPAKAEAVQETDDELERCVEGGRRGGAQSWFWAPLRWVGRDGR